MSYSLLGMLKSSGVFAVMMILQKMIGFLMLPVYTNYINVDDYGAIEFMTVVVSLLEVLLGMRLGQAMSKFYFEKNNAQWRSGVIYSSLILTLPVNILIMMFLLVGAEVVSSVLFGGTGYAGLVALFAVLIPLQMLEAHGLDYIRLELNTRIFLYASTAKILIQVLSSLYMIVELNMGMYGVVISSILATFVSSLIYQANILFRHKFEVDKKILVTLLLFSIPLWGAGIIGVGAGGLDKYMIRINFGLGDLGRYALVAKFASIAGIFWRPIAMVWQPIRFKIYHDANIDDEETRKIFRNVFKLILFVMVFLILGLSLFTPDLIFLISDKQYHGLEYIIVPLSFSGLVGYLIIFVTFGLLLKSQTKYMMYGQIVFAIGLIIFLLIQSSWITLYGVAVSVLAAQMLRFVFVYLKSKENYDMGLPVGKSVILFIAVYLLASITQAVPPGVPIYFGLKFLLYMIITIGGFYFYYSGEEIEDIRSYVRLRK